MCQLTAACGVFVAAAEEALAAFDADSQVGVKTVRTAKRKRLNAENINALLTAMAQQPEPEDPDIILNCTGITGE